MFRYTPIHILAFLLTLLFLSVFVRAHSEEAPKTQLFPGTKNTPIQHLEPPFWWAGMKNQKLQLMVHGHQISRYEVSTSSYGWSIESLEQTDNPNYLFINIRINAGAKPGNYPLTFVDPRRDFEFSISYRLKARRNNSSERSGFDSSDVIYLITPDRFANGDASNDKVAEMAEGPNRKDSDGRHGGDIQGVIDHLDYIENMGFSQIWLNPVLENAMPRSTYHGYSTTDYYAIDPRFGSNALYQTLSSTAKSRGIGLIKDVILNHVGTEHWWMSDLPSRDWINNNPAIDHQPYVETTHRRESLHDPHAAPEDIEAFASGWFVPTMADLNQRNPLLANYIIQNNIWWVEFADLSGIRVDTFSYSDKAFLAEYTHRLMSEYPNFNIVAEEWSTTPIITSYWQRGNKTHDGFKFELPSLMDFPLQDRLVKGIKEKETWSDGLRKLYEVLASDFVYADPYNLVIFPDNHDMSRIHTQLGNDLALTKLAIAFIATTRGIPQYFYGTELAMSNPDTDAHGVIRSDFPGGWHSDNTNAFTGSNLTAEQKDMQQFMRKLLQWRKKTKVVHHGKLTHYSPKKGTYIYFRHDDHNKVMVVLNKSDELVEINPKDYPSMLSEESDHAVKDIISGDMYRPMQAFKIKPKSLLILQIK